MCVVAYYSILQDKSQIEFLNETKSKLRQQLEEECDQLRKDKIKLTGKTYAIQESPLSTVTGEMDAVHAELKMLQQSKESAERKHKQEVGIYFLKCTPHMLKSTSTFPVGHAS